jgi:hypothetical protein
MLGFSCTTLASAATPVASPVALPIVSSYDAVSRDYAAARSALLARGRELADLFFGGEVEAVYRQLSPDVTAMITLEEVATIVPAFEGKRIHFELPEFGVIFDGAIGNGTIDGIFLQGSASTFTLSADGANASTDTLDGLWKGAIGEGATALPIEITFNTAGPTITGAISIPSQALNVPLSNVEAYANRSIGERYAEDALPAGGTNNAFFARYHWGPASLAVQIYLSDSDEVANFIVTPEWPLAEDPVSELVSTVSYQLPFDGQWWVYWGGDTAMQNYHVVAANQRHASDIVIWNKGATFRSDGASNADYWVHGQPLYAPAAGTVVSVLDEFDENAPGTLLPDTHPAGNHIVLQTAESEFIYLAHLVPKSLRVKAGESVAAGTLLAQCGNSGNSSEPHLHIHAQSVADFFSPEAIGLPLRFSRYLADGKRLELGVPLQGQFISR